jgi:deoxyadenosine/deoxycytidine kinase
MNPECSYIAISGPMGIGKTTAAKVIVREFGFVLMEEKFKKNPFVDKATKDPAHFAFNSEVYFLIQKYRQILKAQKKLTKCGVVQDTPIQQDVYSYGKALLHGDEWNLYHELYAALEPRLIKPSLIVCLEASAQNNMKRIRNRGRKFEDTVTPGYIRQLTELNFEWIKESRIPTIYIQTDELNIVRSPKARNIMVGLIRDKLKQMHYTV